MQTTIKTRFSRLKLKDKLITAVDPVTEEEIDLKSHIRELFPWLELERLQKRNTMTHRGYMELKRRHWKGTDYIFEMTKYNDTMHLLLWYGHRTSPFNLASRGCALCDKEALSSQWGSEVRRGNLEGQAFSASCFQQDHHYKCVCATLILSPMSGFQTNDIFLSRCI